MHVYRAICMTIFLILWPIMSSVYCQIDLQADTTDITQAAALYANVHVKVLIYTATAGGKLNKPSLEKLKNALSLVREFYWRNSRCKINLQFSDTKIADHKSASFYPRQGPLTFPYIKADCGETSKADLIVVLFPDFRNVHPLYHELIRNDCSFASIPLPGVNRVPYPVRSNQVDKTIIWPLTWAIHQALLARLGSALASVESYPAIARDSYPAIAHHYRAGLKMETVPFEVLSTPDHDQDGFPDADSLLAMDERRFGSDSTQIDSDNDGLADLLEYAADYYKSASPVRTDSDFDRIPDGRDPYPVNPTPTEIPHFTPNFSGDFRDWFWLTDFVSYSTPQFAGEQRLKVNIYMNWDSTALYLAMQFDAPAEVIIHADIGNDGWNRGANNYHFQLDPFSDRFSEIHVLDMTDKPGTLVPHFKNGMWDDEPRYNSRFGRIIDEFNVGLATHSTEQYFEVRLSIPKSELPAMFLQAGQQLGLQIQFKSIVDDQWASIFPPHQLYILTLK